MAAFFVLRAFGARAHQGTTKPVWEREPLERLARARALAAYVHKGFWQPMGHAARQDLTWRAALGRRQSAVEELVIRREFWAGTRVLDHGHTGFKGSWLALWLASMGARVSGFLCWSPRPRSRRSGRCSAWADEMQDDTADVRDLAGSGWRVCPARPEIVFHLARSRWLRPVLPGPGGYLPTNVMGTVNVLDAGAAVNGNAGGGDRHQRQMLREPREAARRTARD